MKQIFYVQYIYSVSPKLFEIINKRAALRTFPNLYTQHSRIVHETLAKISHSRAHAKLSKSLILNIN
jgi:hypothetical protein